MENRYLSSNEMKTEGNVWLCGYFLGLVRKRTILPGGALVLSFHCVQPLVMFIINLYSIYIWKVQPEFSNSLGIRKDGQCMFVLVMLLPLFFFFSQ